ncbi:2TM domain-containing protein [Maribacter sp. MAR_2009_72]|uniref:2TM domain-containing protein n=1 Tax=Maribacter sp. MAR_2009_72 TaxID=1250050 RepID=UPI00119B0AB2|nr:2TM domain-containing protein [Maribacter sp. MAR_2009_72]TVZ14630.1 2TM domain-containing protein [Maribacter sp. MAR_2009_72]
MDNTKYNKAKERVVELKEFYGKVFSALGTIVIVAALNYYFNEWRYPWFLWVVFAFAISLFLKAIKIFNFNPFFGRDWEERKLREFIQQEENEQRWK